MIFAKQECSVLQVTLCFNTVLSAEGSVTSVAHQDLHSLAFQLPKGFTSEEPQWEPEGRQEGKVGLLSLLAPSLQSPSAAIGP